jgi:hypothetical protein
MKHNSGHASKCFLRSWQLHTRFVEVIFLRRSRLCVTMVRLFLLIRHNIVDEKFHSQPLQIRSNPYLTHKVISGILNMFANKALKL